MKRERRQLRRMEVEEEGQQRCLMDDACNGIKDGESINLCVTPSIFCPCPFFFGCRLLMLVCATYYNVMYFHVSMCINACPPLSAFPPFLVPNRYTHSCVYTCGISHSLRLLLYRSSVWLISAILACILHISRSGSSLLVIFRVPHEVHLIVLVVVIIPVRYMTLCVVCFWATSSCLFCPCPVCYDSADSLYAISVSSFSLFFCSWCCIMVPCVFLVLVLEYPNVKVHS